MAKQFWVNNYFIDVNRNQIEHQQQATPIPPKALKVLEVLASRVGEVVSHDELMDIVWENSVVGPNTLQRAIAQLRKAFGDDSKQQAFIKTHSKKGYSLEANVRWEAKLNEQASFKPTTTNNVSKKPIYLTIAASLLLAALFIILWPKQVEVYDRVTPLTASDEQEYNASYSPDGKYLVFNRYVGQCESHLWAKDLSNHQEEKLSTEPGHYSLLSWSSDGSQLAFVLQSDCDDNPEDVMQCWQLQTLDFAQAWNGNAKNQLRYDCAKVRTTHPTWLNDGRIALLQYPQEGTNQNDLVIYDAVANSVSKVPHEQTGHIYSLDYSRQSNTLATVTLQSENEHILRTLTLDGEILNEAQITPLESHTVYARFPIQFSPDDDHFLSFVHGKIYQLSYDGELTLVSPFGYSGLWNPSYHPDQNKFAVTFGTKDFDIGYLEKHEDAINLEIISRSTAVDANARFQPNGDLIAFVSHRSGSSQIWLIDGERVFQLTQFDEGLRASRFDWSPDGRQLAVNVNNQLALVDLDGNTKFIASSVAVDLIMPWTHPEEILVTDNQADNHALFSINIHSSETTPISALNVAWATYDQQNQIMYAEYQGDFWLLSETDKEAVPTLKDKLFSNYALLKDETLYGIDAHAQLWQYNFQSHELKILETLDKDIIYVSDIKDEKMIATKFIGGRRELMEFSRR